MGNTKKFLLDGEPIEVTDTDIESFLQYNPKAIEAKTFIIGNDTVDVGINDIDSFLKHNPKAAEFKEDDLKKKEKSEPTTNISKAIIPGFVSGIQSTSKTEPTVQSDEVKAGISDVTDNLPIMLGGKPKDKSVPKEMEQYGGKVEAIGKTGKTDTKQQAYELSTQGDLELSNKILQEEIKNTDVKDPYIFQLMAHNDMKLGNNESAKGNLNKAVELRKQQGLSSNDLKEKRAVVALKSGDYDLAISDAMDIKGHYGGIKAVTDEINKTKKLAESSAILTNAYSQKIDSINQQIQQTGGADPSLIKKQADYTKLIERERSNTNAYITTSKYLQKKKEDEQIASTLTSFDSFIKGLPSIIGKGTLGLASEGSDVILNAVWETAGGIKDYFTGSGAEAFIEVGETFRDNINEANNKYKNTGDISEYNKDLNQSLGSLVAQGGMESVNAYFQLMPNVMMALGTGTNILNEISPELGDMVMAPISTFIKPEIKTGQSITGMLDLLLVGGFMSGKLSPELFEGIKDLGDGKAKKLEPELVIELQENIPEIAKDPVMQEAILKATDAYKQKKIDAESDMESAPVSESKFVKNTDADIKFKRLAEKIPESEQEAVYSSAKTTEKHYGEAPVGSQEYYKIKMETALRHGLETIDTAKEAYGKDYVDATLDYIEKTNLTPDAKSNLFVNLELDLQKQIKENPNDITLKKQLDLVQQRSQRFAKQTGQGIALRRLFSFARANYNLDKVTEGFFSTRELEVRGKLEKALQSDADTINKEAESIEVNRVKKIELEKEIADKQKMIDELSSVIESYKSNVESKKGKTSEKIKAVQDKIDKAKDSLKSLTYGRASALGILNPEIYAALRTIITGNIEKFYIKTKGKIELGKLFEDSLKEAKEYMPELTEQDIKDSFNNNYEKEIKTKSELSEIKSGLKKEAKQAESKEARDEKESLKAWKDFESELNKKNKRSEAEVKKEKDLEKKYLDAEKRRLEKEAKQAVKEAMIDAGYGREITVTTKSGKEKRMIIDWKKLAGEEGSPAKIKENVEAYLKDKGYSEKEISDMSKELTSEYDNLRSSIIEKSLNELNKGNKEAELSPDQKSAAKRLAEQYNYGLFDKNPAEYDRLLNKVLGVSDASQKTFEQVKDIANGLSELYNTEYQGKKVDPFNVSHMVTVLSDKLRVILNKEISNKEGNGKYRAARIAQSYIEASQRMMLNTVKQRLENPFSATIETAITKIANMKTDTPELKKQRSKMMRSVFSDVAWNKGVSFGKITSQFMTKGGLDDYVNKITDNQVLHGLMSEMIGRPHLEATDAMFKSNLTDIYFKNNLITILTDKSNPKGAMNKTEALHFVSEQLTGQNFKDAQTSAKGIIQKINSKDKLVPENQQTIDRLANDIVRQSLLQNEKMTIDQIESAYDAAYTTAGVGLGHEANNPITMGVKALSGQIENNINEAVKKQEWNKAAAWTLASILSRNILNPFVGGGSNWVVLKLQKSGVDIISPLFDAYQKGKIDLSTNAGINNLKNTLTAKERSRSTNARFLVGASASALTYLTLKASGLDDDYNTWIKKNKWAEKYTKLMLPEAMIFEAAYKDKKIAKYLGTTFNKQESYDDALNLIKGVDKAIKDKDFSKLGESIGGQFGIPIPWRMAKDVESVIRGVSGGEQRSFVDDPKSFIEGYFKMGLFNYITARISTIEKEQAHAENEKLLITKSEYDKVVSEIKEMNPELIEKHIENSNLSKEEKIKLIESKIGLKEKRDREYIDKVNDLKDRKKTMKHNDFINLLKKADYLNYKERKELEKNGTK